MKCYQCGTEFEGNFCTNCGEPVKNEQVKTVLTDENPNQYYGKKTSKKNKKPLYKKPLFIVIVALLLIGAVSSIAETIKENRTEKIVWSEMELGEMLPVPKVKRGHIYDNTEDCLHIELKKVSDDDYKTYVNECKEYGFTIDPVSSASSYKAFNDQGYMLDISVLLDSMSLELDKPVEFSSIQWPNSLVGKLLPLPKSLKGNFDYEHDTGFSVKIGDTSIDAYNDYVNECLEKGFNKDYTKNDRSFYADNTDGYHVKIDYIGNNIMSIRISEPYDMKTTEEEKDTTTTTTTTTTTKATSKPMNQNSKGLRPDFKKAMDSYEKFMDEYVAFMKKYQKSGGTDLSILSDYASYMSKYSDMCEDFEKWEDDDLNDAELAYYLDVQARVSKKLIDVAY